MKKVVTSLYIIVTLIGLAACSSEPSSSSDSNTSQASEQEQPKAQNKGVTITAFLRGQASDEAAAKAFEQGMDLAINAKSPPSITSKFLDRAQGKADNPALQSLIGGSPIAVYWQTSDLEPAASILKQSDLISIPVWNVTEKVAALGTKVFGFGYSTERSFAEYSKFAGNKLKSYRFGVFSSSAEPFSTQSQAFIEETKSQGNTIVFEEKVDSPSVDFKALITKATKEKCDTVFAVLPSDALVAFIKAARAASFPGKILVGDSFFGAEREALGKDAEGIYLLQSWSDDAALKSQYSAKYGSEPDGVTLGAAALGFDLIKCVEAAGANLNPDSISYAWLSTPCEGLTGKTQFSGERIAQRQKRILTVKGEKFELVG